MESYQVKLRLRNVKCLFVLHDNIEALCKKFQLHEKNYTLRLDEKICLTIYPNSKYKLHATGISGLEDLEQILYFFVTNEIKVKSVEVNNTFWLIKPLIIKNFDKFAQFCKTRQKLDSVTINLNNLGLNGDGGFLNAIFLRHLDVNGSVIIHRTCSLILGPKNIDEVKLLSYDLQMLLNSYSDCLNSN